MASQAASLPTPSRGTSTSTASEVHSEQTVLPTTAHVRSGATAATSASHIGNSPPFLCVCSLSASHSCSEGKQEGAKAGREGIAPVPTATMSNARLTPAQVGEARVATTGPSAPSDASSSAAASFARAPQPSPKNSAVETNDVVFAPVADGDVWSIMEEYYGNDLNWASSPTNERNASGKTASQTPARSSPNARVATASSTCAEGALRVVAATSPVRAPAVSPAAVVACVPSSATFAQKDKADGSWRVATPLVLVRAGDVFENSDGTPPLMLSPPPCPPPAPQQPPHTTPATALRPHYPVAVAENVQDARGTVKSAQKPPTSQLHPGTPTTDGAPAQRYEAAHTAIARTTTSTTVTYAPPTPVRNLSSTPAATSLRRCHIPPIALLDGPQRRDSGSTKDNAAASASSVPVPALTTPTGPPMKRGSRLNTPFANIGRAAPAQPGALPQLGNTRPARVPRVSFRDGDVVALPDSQALRTPTVPLLVFRNPTMRERGKETMAAPDEVYAQLLQRGAAVCTLAVVDEDAMRHPCLVASGFSVRVFEEDRALALGKGRIAHGAMKVLHSFRNRLRSGGSGDGGRDVDSAGRRLSADAGSSDSSASNANASETSGDAPASAPTATNATAAAFAGSSSGSILMVPNRKDRRSRSADTSADAQPSEFERFLHKIVFDEALSRPKGESGCDSVTLQLLARRWEAGQNTCLIFGNGSGRSIQCFDVAVGVVKDAMAKLRARLRDPASTAELQMHMGDVFAESVTGRVRVQDLLVRGRGSDSDTSSSTSDAGEQNGTAGVTAEEEEQRRFPQVRLARSPLTGTFATGLSVVTAADALSDASAIFGALGRGFHQYNVSTHSSRNGSFSSVQSTANVATLGAHACFAVLRLRTVCRGKDMRSAPLSAREATSVGEERVSTRQQRQNKKGAPAVPVLHHRTTECAADVFVSTLLLTFFGTEHHVFKSIVENTLIALKQARGGAFVVAAEQLHFSPTDWTDPVHFLYSLMRDALGGRTHTAACLCLSEYDSHVTPWLHVMERARAILNSEPHNGNLRSYLHYLLEQYENMDAQQRRERKGMGARRAEGRGDGRPSEISMYLVQKLVSSLDQYLASPVGEPPLLERLEIKNADVLPAVSADPVSAPALTALATERCYEVAR